MQINSKYWLESRNAIVRITFAIIGIVAFLEVICGRFEAFDSFMESHILGEAICSPSSPFVGMMGANLVFAVTYSIDPFIVAIFASILAILANDYILRNMSGINLYVFAASFVIMGLLMVVVGVYGMLLQLATSTTTTLFGFNIKVLLHGIIIYGCNIGFYWYWLRKAGSEKIKKKLVT